jgi:hypothetical protein
MLSKRASFVPERSGPGSRVPLTGNEHSNPGPYSFLTMRNQARGALFTRELVFCPQIVGELLPLLQDRNFGCAGQGVSYLT